jgi:IS1 family transposase/transposase-like protein
VDEVNFSKNAMKQAWRNKMIITKIVHKCPKCGSETIVKNGHDYKGSQKYWCQACNQYGTLIKQASRSDGEREQIRRAVIERLSLRAIARIFNISRQTVNAYVFEWVADLPDLEASLVAAQLADILELDELWSFVQHKGQQRWLWVALCRRTRQIVAYYLGDRTRASCLKLWQRLPRDYVHCRSFSDFWQAYQSVFDHRKHTCVGKDSGETAHVERWFCTLRQRLARFVRKALSFSKVDKFHEAYTRFFIHHYNLSCISQL